MNREKTPLFQVTEISLKKVGMGKEQSYKTAMSSCSKSTWASAPCFVN